jgi:hypothetical protein
MGPRDIVRVSPRALLTELGDGTGVVLDLDTKFYFNLNRTGVTVWKALAAQADGATPRALAELLVQRFDVALEAALSDVLGLLDTMAGEALVKITPV